MIFVALLGWFLALYFAVVGVRVVLKLVELEDLVEDWREWIRLKDEWAPPLSMLVFERWTPKGLSRGR